MFENFIAGLKNGFITANATRKLVFGDRQLFIYPILAVLISLILIGALAAVTIFAVIASLPTGLATNVSTIPTAILVALVIPFFLVYVLVFFVVVYFTTAMLIAFREYSNGNKISLGQALAKTKPYAKNLLEWAFFISTIKVILDVINALISSALRRYGAIGNIITRVLVGVEGLALTIVGLFALPVILDEDTGPIATLKESTKFIIKNFGETFSGFLYSEIIQIVLAIIGELFIAASILLVISTVVGAATFAQPSTAPVFLVIVSVIALVFILPFTWKPTGAILLFIVFILGAVVFHVHSIGVISIALLGVGATIIAVAHLIRYVLFNCFKLVVYEYKTKGALPKDFDAKLIDTSIKSKYGFNNASNKGGPGTQNLNLFGSGNQNDDK